MRGAGQLSSLPTAEENNFCSSSSAQGAQESLSTRTLSGKMPKNCTGSHSGQDHCLHLYEISQQEQHDRTLESKEL